jgi:hypothetical protein
MVLPENNRGLSYSRNNIKAYAQQNGLDFYWLLDDDIKFYQTMYDGKMLKRDYTCLTEAEEILFKYDFAQASLEYRQFAWSDPDKITENKYCHCAVLFNTRYTNEISADENLQLKIDQDYTINLLSKGFKTLRICRYAISSPKNGSNAGGLKDVYPKEEENCYKLIEKWGDKICQKIVKDDGRHDVRINWHLINDTQIELF